MNHICRTCRFWEAHDEVCLLAASRHGKPKLPETKFWAEGWDRYADADLKTSPEFGCNQWQTDII
jgi:hypothetical protein